MCHGKPCWKATATTGFKYADRDLTPDGLLGLTIRTSRCRRCRSRRIRA